jgi:hypothetical protein
LASYKYREMTETKQAKRVMTMRVTVITISQSLREYLNNIPGKHEVKELQDTAWWTQRHILGKVLK